MIHFERINDFRVFEKQLHRFMQSVSFGRYLSDRSVDSNIAIKYELGVLKEYIKNDGICYVGVSEYNNIYGIIGFHYSSWDTDVLGKRTAIIKYLLIREYELSYDRDISTQLIDLFHLWAEENIIDVAIVKLETRCFTPIFILQRKGYIFFECNTIKALDLTKNVHWDLEKTDFRFANKDDLEYLKTFALKNTFTKSHFYLDTNFDKEKVNSLYAKWIDSALSSNKNIILIEYGKIIAGVFIYDIETLPNLLDRKTANWHFGAIDGSLRNRGLGSNLFQSVIQACIDQKIEIINSDLVAKNAVSQRLHDKLGFKLVHTTYTFHKWFRGITVSPLVGNMRR